MCGVFFVLLQASLPVSISLTPEKEFLERTVAMSLPGSPKRDFRPTVVPHHFGDIAVTDTPIMRLNFRQHDEDFAPRPLSTTDSERSSADWSTADDDGVSNAVSGIDIKCYDHWLGELKVLQLF